MSTEALRRTEAAQARAADPAASAWVRANAGTGKTHVLVARVLRLLLDGAPPEGIVCLTFTKAAAAEMANRLSKELGEWAIMTPQALEVRLAKLMTRAPSSEETLTARRLFSRVLDTPGGLRIQTIHAFCERVLRQFPLEADVAPGFSVMSEADSHAGLRAATSAVLEEAACAPETALGAALETVAAHAAETQFETLLGAVLRARAALAGMIAAAEAAASDLEHLIAQALGAPADADLDGIAQAQAEVLSDEQIARVAQALGQGSEKTDGARAANLRRAMHAQTGSARIEAFCDAFLTKDGKPRADSRFFTKAVERAAPEIAAELRGARDRFAELERTRRALETAHASAALLTLADAIINRYERAKRAEGALDYDDLIAHTIGLLTHGSAWVLYRLDGGIDHILIDEAQDNSLAQWRVAELLSEEFFAGAGAREARRSLFAVGDEKQSIYGFQGAAPDHFAEAGRRFRARAQQGRHTWYDEPLNLSFRTVAPVLRAVDLVFGGENGLGARIGAQDEVRHDAHREGEPGLVEVWPTEMQPDSDEAEPWAPHDETHAEAGAVERLADRIAGRIRAWLDDREILASQERPIRPSDILILVRKRAPFAAPMIAALKRRGIPVAGADRMRLTEQLAVMDLMALGDALLLPGDDLSLACVLKSPVFGLSEDDLFALAHGREGSLWEALEDSAADISHFSEAEAQLATWRDEALSLRPFEFYAALLDRDGVRARLLAGSGPEAGDAIDAFMNLALTYEETGPASLQGFLAWLRETGSEVRRDMEQGAEQVRVMTVHGAKGLEANIVILPDTCSMRPGTGGPIVRLRRDAPGVFGDCLVWATGGAGQPAIEAARGDIRSAEEAESYRLLYVAMTRARDRLYVTGFENRSKRGRDDGCWYDIVRSALEGEAERAADAEGREILRLVEARGAVVAPQRTDAAATVAPPPLPRWLTKPAPQEAAPQTARPSAKGGAPAQPGQGGAPAEAARLRGEIIHLLLERLPAIRREDRRAEAERLMVDAVAIIPGVELEAQAREEMIETALGIVETPDFAHLFASGSRAEVPIAAALPPEAMEGGIHMSGRIDRLVVRGEDVLIIDYKTDLRIPETPEAAPEGYVAQLAAYRAALERIFAEKEVRAFILWTGAPSLMEIPEALLACVPRALDEPPDGS